MTIRCAHCRGSFDLIVDLCDPSDTHQRFVGWRFEPSLVDGWCFGGRRLQWGRGSGWRHIFISHSLTAVTATHAVVVLSTCNCEKLEQLLVRLGTTLINRVDKGPKESGGGIGGGIGGGMGVGVVVGAEQRAALREA